MLADGYDPDVFVDGPLVSAMRDGSLLYIEEINRIPEETLNVLITVMSERELHVPRFGRVVAEPGFRLVAAMNPFDAIGTARISSAVYDRVCRLSVDYQSASDEEAIVSRLDRSAAGSASGWPRSSRSSGSPERIPTCASARRCAVRSTSPRWRRRSRRLRHSSATAFDVGLDSAIVALVGPASPARGRGAQRRIVVTELWYQVFAEREVDSPGKVAAPDGAARQTP